MEGGNNNLIPIIVVIVIVIILLVLFGAFYFASKDKGGRKRRVRLRFVRGKSGNKGSGQSGASRARAANQRQSSSVAGRQGNADGSSARGQNGSRTGAKVNPQAGGNARQGQSQAGNKGGEGARSANVSKAVQAVAASSGASSGKLPPLQGAKGASGQRLPTLGAMNDDIEKYARATINYLETKHGIEIERVGLRKYYSERHGFNCVDFTYKPAAGTMPAAIKMHMNDLDTALSNMMGVDTITFQMDGATGGTFKTTFYLNQ